MEAKHESLFARITKWLRRVKKAPGIEANGTTRTSEPIETSTETNETAQPQNHSLSKLGQKLDNLTSRLEYVYGPDHILLKYRCAVIAQQMSVEHDRQRFGTSEISRPNTQQIEREQHLIPVRLWECDTLIVPRNSEAFKVWLLETLDSIVTDFARDWQADYTAPGIPVLIYKGIKDRRELEISPGIWVIDVDVEGAVVWCDIDWCDPNVDEGDIITIGKQVLESTLSFKLIPTGETETEVRCFCGARELAQQYTRAKEMITERWPATQYLQRSDTDVSFRGVTKRANPGTAQQTPIPPTQAANAETTSRQPPPDEQGLLGRKGEHPGQHEQQESYSSQEVELADALRKHQYLPMPHTGRLEPLIVQPTDIKSFSNWFIKTTDSIIDEEQFKVANGWIVLWPIETPHSPDTYGANLAIWGNYTFPSATTAQSYASVVLRSPAVTFNLLRLDSVRIQVTIEYTLVTIAPYIRKLLLKIGKAWPASEQSILDLLTTKKQEDGNQDVQRASKLHPMSRQWPSIQTDKESFHKRLSEAVARIPHDMRRIDRSDDEFEIMKAEVTPLPTLETDPDVLRLGLEVTCYPSLKGEKREGPHRSPEFIGYGIEFDMRTRKGGLINVYAFGDPAYKDVFEALAKEIDWAIEHDDWPESKQTIMTLQATKEQVTQTQEGGMKALRKRWLGIETSAESFTKRLHEAVARMGNFRIEFPEGGHAILEPRLVSLVTGGRQPHPDDTILWGWVVTCYSRPSESEDGTQVKLDMFNPNPYITFEIRRRQGGRISVEPACTHHYFADAFQGLVAEIDEAVRTGDWPELQQTVSASLPGDQNGEALQGRDRDPLFNTAYERLKTDPMFHRVSDVSDLPSFGDVFGEWFERAKEKRSIYKKDEPYERKKFTQAMTYRFKKEEKNKKN